MELKAVDHASTYIIQSQEEELKRIAALLHEGINQNLYSINTGLKFLESGMEQPVLKEYAKEMANLINRTIQEIRLLSVELYPATISTLGLTAALKSYIKLYMNTFGIMVDIFSSGEETAIEECNSMAVFRVCQEALFNIAKYADVSEAMLRFTWEANKVTIEVEDKGKGFNIQEAIDQNRLKGIAAMHQRMAYAGGTCDITSQEGSGTVVKITLPIDK